MSDETLRVEIEGDEVSTDRGGGRSGSRSSRGGDDPAARLQAAERDKAAAFAELRRANADLHHANQRAAAGRLATVESRAGSVQSQIREAMEIGDYAKATDLQAQLAELVVDKRAVQQWKAQVDRAPVSTGDPAEDMLAEMARAGAPRSAEWLRRHPEFMADEAKNARVKAAHFDAVAKKIVPETDAYFAHVEKYVGIGGERGGGRTAGGASREIEVDAHVGIGDRIPANASTIHMTREAFERAKETAESLGLDVKEYLRRKRITDNAPEWQRIDS